jgi:hypothetical protein
MATGRTSSEDPRQRLAFQLRRINVELDQLGHQFATSVTALVDRLERQGHLSRVRDQRDRRRVTLEIEHQALALGAEFFGPLNTELLTAMEAFSDADLEVVGRFLEAMTEVIVTNRRARQVTNGQP